MAKETRPDETALAIGGNALDILHAHALEAPYDPGFMPITANKGAKSFNMGALGTKDGPLECIIFSANTRRGLWPPDPTVSKEQLGIALEIMPDGVGSVEGLDAWRGKRPLCGSSNNGGARGEMPKVIDAGAPSIVEQICGPAIEADFRCAKCKWNQFGSDWRGGAGKACKETRMLLLYFDAEDMAATISATPSSLRNWRDYKTSLPRQNFASCFTSIATVPVTQGSYSYNVLEFEPVKIKSKIVAVEPIHLAKVGEMVTYGGREVMKLQALIAEFLNIELEEDLDYQNGDKVEDDDSGTPFDDEDF